MEAAYCPAGKKNCKCWACREVGHYADECKNTKNNKLIETLSSLDYVELSEDEALDQTLSNNKLKELLKVYWTMNMKKAIIKKQVI